MIAFEDFQKLDIRIGKIISVEKVPETDKLVKLIFDIGSKELQIIAGIAEHFEDLDELIGKQMPLIINLEPRKMRGLESQGMILAIDDNDGMVLLQPEKEVKSGSKVR
ncbi:methionine--tRNA ligase subunit beta [Candidatus Falkowbacteria bacterium]|jgi:methionine--tRNA ligase beta chain|nr:methionine--tRNA ligase subunit beta [Candidatus Falkowbacteria bacterium]MBT4433242.1 methionine--tRNA ligase subunit beta [Candidatus Falkowbacteria bacterium]